jgi:hypothetical protein
VGSDFAEVWSFYQANGDVVQSISFVEYFAGCKAITMAMRAHGRIVASYEMLDDPKF